MITLIVVAVLALVLGVIVGVKWTNWAVYMSESEISGLDDWWVYSTAVAEGAILVENRTTGQRATVRDPTREEWSAAFHAPSNPYRWLYPERLAIDS